MRYNLDKMWSTVPTHTKMYHVKYRPMATIGHVLSTVWNAHRKYSYPYAVRNLPPATEPDPVVSWSTVCTVLYFWSDPGVEHDQPKYKLYLM